MPEVRRRTRKTRPVEEDDFEDFDDEVENDEDLEDEEEDDEVVRPRDRARAAKKAPARRRRTPVEEDDEEDDDEDTDFTDVEDDEEDEESPRRRRPAKKAAAARPARRRRSTEDDDEEETPRRRRPASRSKSDGGPPPGVRVGGRGAEETRKSGGPGLDRIQLGSEPELIKVLGNYPDEPFVSLRQHWVTVPGAQGNRPFTCPGKKECPLCNMGDMSNAAYVFNVLHLSGSAKPENKVLQISTKPYEAWKKLATDKTTGKILFGRNYWAVSKSGKKQTTQTNFLPVKVRDLEEEWPELFEHFDLEDLPDIVARAKKGRFDYTVIEHQTIKKLKEVARYAADDFENDEEDED